MKRALRITSESIIVLVLLVLVYLEFREYGLWILLEAYAALKVLCLVLGIIYCKAIKHKKISLRLVFLLGAFGGLYLSWILSAVLFYHFAGKHIVRSGMVARWEEKLSGYLV